MTRRVSRLTGPSRQTCCGATRRCSRSRQPIPRRGCFVDRYRTPGGCTPALRRPLGAWYRSAWQRLEFAQLRLKGLPTDDSRSDHHATLELESLAGLARLRRSNGLGRIHTVHSLALMASTLHSLSQGTLVPAIARLLGATAIADVLGPLLGAGSILISDWGVAARDHALSSYVQRGTVNQSARQRARVSSHQRAVPFRHSRSKLLLLPHHGVATKPLERSLYWLHQADRSRQRSPSVGVTAASAYPSTRFSN